MPTFCIIVVNETFEARNHHEAATVGEARHHAMKGALEIGVEEVSKGSRFFAAEVKLEDDGELVDRFVVSVGTSPLQKPQG